MEKIKKLLAGLWRCEACRSFSKPGDNCEHCGARNRSK